MLWTHAHTDSCTEARTVGINEVPPTGIHLWENLKSYEEINCFLIYYFTHWPGVNIIYTQHSISEYSQTFSGRKLHPIRCGNCLNINFIHYQHNYQGLRVPFFTLRALQTVLNDSNINIWTGWSHVLLCLSIDWWFVNNLGCIWTC